MIYTSLDRVSDAVHHAARVSGVFQIRNKATGDLYVGSTVDLYRRLTQMKSRLQQGRSSVFFLQRAVRRYGVEQFEWTVLDTCSPEELKAREAVWVAKLQPMYNKPRSEY